MEKRYICRTKINRIEKDYEETYDPFFMKISFTILNVAGVVQIVYSIVSYYTYGQKNDPEGWGMLATIVLVAFGAGAIVLDLILQKLIKRWQTLLLIEIIIVLVAWFFIYKY